MLGLKVELSNFNVAVDRLVYKVFLSRQRRVKDLPIHGNPKYNGRVEQYLYSVVDYLSFVDRFTSR